MHRPGCTITSTWYYTVAGHGAASSWMDQNGPRHDPPLTMSSWMHHNEGQERGYQCTPGAVYAASSWMHHNGPRALSMALKPPFGQIFCLGSNRFKTHGERTERNIEKCAPHNHVLEDGDDGGLAEIADTKMMIHRGSSAYPIFIPETWQKTRSHYKAPTGGPLPESVAAAVASLQAGRPRSGTGSLS